LFKGIMKEMLAAEDQRPESVFDHDFITKYTAGFEPFIDSLRTASWEPILASSGLTRDQIRQAGQVAMNTKSLICCWAMGLTQHRNAVPTVREIINFLLLRGNIGRPGAGACPVHGHSNVQGDRTMGIWQRPSPELLDRLAERYHFEPPREAGTDVVDTIKAMHRSRIKVFFAMGGNFLSATPDTEFTARALSRCRLTVQVSTKLNRGHLITGEQALILPCLGRTDRDMQAGGAQFVTVENSMGIVHSSRGNLDPPSEHLMSEPAIVARLAAAVLGERTDPGQNSLDWLNLVEDYERIRDLIARIVPGCDDMNRKVRRRGGFYLPNAARDDEYATSTGHANFTVSPIEPVHLEPGKFLLTTLRSHDQYNTTIYGLDDRYRGIFHGRRVVLLNPEDLHERGWKIRAVIAKSEASARRAVRSIGGGRAYAEMVQAVFSAPIILICVPESAIPGVVKRLASFGEGEWRKKIVLHTSGALGSSVLAELRSVGAAIGSIHPLQTFSGVGVPDFDGTVFAIEGDSAALRIARGITRTLGGQPVQLKSCSKSQPCIRKRSWMQRRETTL